ncbi:hypothetical protein V6574_33780 [Streptomyces sp. SM1P]
MTTTTDVRPAAEKSGRASTAARPVRWWSGRVSFRMHRRTALVSGGALLLAALLLLVSLSVGSYPVSVPDVARALFYGTGTGSRSTSSTRSVCRRPCWRFWPAARWA